jgi:hypothetical protein
MGFVFPSPNVEPRKALQDSLRFTSPLLEWDRLTFYFFDSKKIKFSCFVFCLFILCVCCFCFMSF